MMTLVYDNSEDDDDYDDEGYDVPVLINVSKRKNLFWWSDIDDAKLC